MQSVTRSLFLIAMAFFACFGLWHCSGTSTDKAAPLSTARNLLADGNTDQAAALLQPMVQSGSDTPEVYYLMGQVAQQRRQWTAAAQWYQQALAMAPGHQPAELALAEIFLAAGQYDQARSHIEAVLRAEPRHIAALVLKGALLAAQGGSAEAEQLLAGLVSEGVCEPQAALLLAAVRRQQKDTDGAVRALEAGIACRPGHVPLHLSLARLLVEAGQPAAAEAAVRQAMELAPDNPDHVLSLAGLRWAQGDTEAAEALLAQLLRASEGDGYTLVADFYLQRDRIEGARETLQAGIAARPGDAGVHMALARFHALTGDNRKGIEILLAFLGNDAKPTGAGLHGVHLALARAYAGEHDWDAAARYVDRVLDDDPDHVDALYWRGRTAAARGQSDRAVSAFKAVLAARPDLADVYLQLARVYVLQGEAAAAAAVLTEGVERFPSQRALHLELARAHLSRGDYKAAEAGMVRWLRIAPADMEVQAELGDFYLDLKDVNRAEREYAEIVRKFPDQDLGYIKLARLYAGRNAFAEALAELGAGLGRNPGSEDLLAELVRTHLAAGDAEAALALCRERLTRDEADAFAHHLMGQVHLHRKNLREAAKAFERAAAITPEWIEPGNHLAAVHLADGKQKEAERVLSAALEQNPRNPAAFLTLARLREEAGQYDAAIALYERALAAMPDFSTAAARLALLLCERKDGHADLDRALALAMAAYRRNPGRADVLQAIAWVYYHRGAHDKALALLAPIAERAPGDPLVNYHLGMALLKSGQREKARGKLALALQEKTPFVGRADAEQALKTIQADRS